VNKLDFPRLVRKKTIEDMWKDFEKREKLLASLEEEHMATRADIAQMKTIGRSSYFSVASAITSEQEQMVKCINYCTDILVNAPVQGLRKIIMDEAGRSSDIGSELFEIPV
jgi:hypothetical protein